jgi:hypothetical protein
MCPTSTAISASRLFPCRLTSPSSGRSKGRFAPFGPPPMSNVRPQCQISSYRRGLLRSGPSSCRWPTATLLGGSMSRSTSETASHWQMNWLHLYSLGPSAPRLVCCGRSKQIASQCQSRGTSASSNDGPASRFASSRPCPSRCCPSRRLVLSSLPPREKATAHSNTGAGCIGLTLAASALESEESPAPACRSYASPSTSSSVDPLLGPNPSIERRSSSKLCLPTAAAHVER